MEPTPPPSSEEPKPQPPVSLDYATPQKRPFPWRDLLQFSVLMLAMLLLGLYLLLPERDFAPTTVCQSNLRQIGLGICMYATDYGQYPADLTLLMSNSYLQAGVFTCPESGDKMPVSTSSPQQGAADLIAGGHLSYVYVGRGLSPKDISDPATTILVYEAQMVHAKGSVLNVLFADGHADAIRGPQARQVLDRLRAGISTLPPDSSPPAAATQP